MKTVQSSGQSHSELGGLATRHSWIPNAGKAGRLIHSNSKQGAGMGYPTQATEERQSQKAERTEETTGLRAG